MGLFDKIKDTAKNLRDDAIKKLAYSEDDIAERKKKEGKKGRRGKKIFCAYFISTL